MKNNIKHDVTTGFITAVCTSFSKKGVVRDWKRNAGTKGYQEEIQGKYKL